MIRNANERDFQTLLAIDRGCFAEGIAYDSAELAHFINHDQAQTLVLEKDGEIAGFLIIEIREIRRRRKAATMITLDVRSEHRRKGYASNLVERSIEVLEAGSVEVYELQVDIYNTGAIAFYRKHGFRIAGTIHHYYPNGHDAHVMVRKLRSAAGG